LQIYANQIVVKAVNSDKLSHKLRSFVYGHHILETQGTTALKASTVTLHSRDTGYNCIESQHCYITFLRHRVQLHWKPALLHYIPETQGTTALKASTVTLHSWDTGYNCIESQHCYITSSRHRVQLHWKPAQLHYILETQGTTAL